MLKTEPSRVQKDSPLALNSPARAFPLPQVLAIAEQWMAGLRKVDPDLILQSRLQTNLNQGSVP